MAKPVLGISSTTTPPPVRDNSEQTIFHGIIHDSTMFAHSYAVQTDRGATVLAIDLARGTANDAVSFRSYGMYTPGTPVLCWKEPFSHVAYILGAITPPMASTDTNMSDRLEPGSATSYLDTHVHKTVQTINPQATPWYSGHRPVDTFPGEQGWVNSLGVGIHLSTYRSQLTAGEMANITAFQQNQLLRVGSFNFQHWAGAFEIDSQCDEVELNTVTRHGMYYFESMGVTAAGVAVAREGSSDWKEGNTQDVLEPRSPLQQGIYRLQEFSGYLGDIYRRVVSCPPDLVDGVATADDLTVHRGLFEEVVRANGLYSVRSAYGISLQKYLLIPVPKQLRSGLDPTGDVYNRDNYKFGGLVGTGDEHRTTEPSVGTSAADHVLNLYDYHAWAFNAYALAGFTYHKKDWYLPQEKLVAAAWKSYAISSEYQGHMGNKYEADLPVPLLVKIDHRPGHNHQYYASKASIDILPDGQIVLEDGWGSRIRMGGGNIEFSSQGDVAIRPGRTVQVWGPKDVVIKSGNCIDITTAKGDVRIKGERNVHVLAGNSGTGGMLLESRSDGFTQDFAGHVGTDVNSSGITLLSRTGPVLTYGREVYVRSLDQGNICIDADRGHGNIQVYAKSRLETVSDQIQVAYGAYADSNITTCVCEVRTGSIVSFGQKSQFLTAAAQVMCTAGTLWTSGFVNSVSGFNQVPARPIGPLGGAAAQVAAHNSLITQFGSRVAEVHATYRDQYYAADSRFKFGNKALITNLGFSLRSDQQYNLTGFQVGETTWQRMLSGSQATVWYEPVVTAPGSNTKTMPFPGYDTWTTKKVYHTKKPTLWDSEHRYNSDRPYSDATLALNEPKAETKTLASSYVINTQE